MQLSERSPWWWVRRYRTASDQFKPSNLNTITEHRKIFRARGGIGINRSLSCRLFFGILIAIVRLKQSACGSDTHNIPSPSICTRVKYFGSQSPLTQYFGRPSCPLPDSIWWCTWAIHLFFWDTATRTISCFSGSFHAEIWMNWGGGHHMCQIEQLGLRLRKARLVFVIRF